MVLNVRQPTISYHKLDGFGPSVPESPLFMVFIFQSFERFICRRSCLGVLGSCGLFCSLRILQHNILQGVLALSTSLRHSEELFARVESLECDSAPVKVKTWISSRTKAIHTDSCAPHPLRPHRKRRSRTATSSLLLD